MGPYTENPWFGDTAEFVVYPVCEEDEIEADFPYELWQRMTLKDAVMVDVLASLDVEGLTELVEFHLPRIPQGEPQYAGYRVTYENEVLIERQFREEV
ncbi:hypothetical protein JW921_05920 [Candidatus Fermentibacterales bacterium]|nr:hypothetical protein [Candidatus Fermentibacterales bacterium]